MFFSNFLIVIASASAASWDRRLSSHNLTISTGEIEVAHLPEVTLLNHANTNDNEYNFAAFEPNPHFCDIFVVVFAYAALLIHPLLLVYGVVKILTMFLGVHLANIGFVMITTAISYALSEWYFYRQQVWENVPAQDMECVLFKEVRLWLFDRRCTRSTTFKAISAMFLCAWPFVLLQLFISSYAT